VLGVISGGEGEAKGKGGWVGDGVKDM